MVGMYDQGGGLLEKLQQLGIKKLTQLLPMAGAAIGSGLGGPVGGFAGSQIGGGLESILGAGLGGNRNPYEGLGMSPEGMGIESMSQPGLFERMAGQGAQGLGNLAGQGAMQGLGSLAGLSGMGGSGGGMSDLLKQLLSQMPEEEIMKLLEARKLSGAYQGE